MCNKNKKILDKEKNDDIITCPLCGNRYFKNTDPYSKDIKCSNCFDDNGNLFFWKR